MQGRTISKISKTVFHFFGDRLEKLGREVKFIQRKSKLKAKIFVDVLVMGYLSDSKLSLEGLCQLIKLRKVKITKQALNERFDAEAVELMENVFEDELKTFQTEREPLIDLLKPFSNVKIHDSSGISLPESLKEKYQGFGGGASEAGLKVQLTLEYIKGQVDKVEVTAGRKNDQGFKNYLEDIEKDSLYLQDLGYFDLESFKKIQSARAYFISRFFSNTRIYADAEASCPMDFVKELQKAGDHFGRKVWLGKKAKLAVRLIAYRLPQEAYEERVRKLKAEGRKKGYAPKKETLEFAKWSIFITNAGEALLNDKQVYLLYTLRWQIELFFKLCKSKASIDKFTSKNPYRVLCEFYAKLIGVVMLLYLVFPVRWQETQELSFYKAYQLLRRNALEYFKALKSVYKLIQFLKGFLSDLKDFALKEKPRKKRCTTFQKLMKSTGQEVLA